MTFEELNVVRTLRKQIADEERKLAGFKDLARSVTPQFNRVTENGKSFTCLDVSPKGNNPDSRVETIATLITDTENILTGLRRRVETEIPLLTKKIQEEFKDTNAQTLLLYRYVFGKHFRDIGFLMNYSESRVYCMHGNLMKKLQKST